MKRRQFEIYATKRSIVSLRDPVRIKIMHFLAEGPKNFGAVVKHVKRVKSTVSSHMDKLEAEKLVQFERDPEDSRRKIYRTNASLLGTMAKANPKLYKKALEDMEKSMKGGSFKFMNSLFRSIRYIFDAFGMNTEPLLKLMGENVGYEISKKIKSQDNDGVMKELSEFWAEQDLGDMRVLKKEPLTVVVKNCYQCSNMQNVGRPLCAFDEGVIKSVLENKLDINADVRETECNGTGHKHCKFEVKLT